MEIYLKKAPAFRLEMNVVEESDYAMRSGKAVVQLCCDVLSDADIAYLEENLQQQDSCVRQRLQNLLP